MTAHYSPVPNHSSDSDRERELNDAFESDHEDDPNLTNESTPLTNHNDTHRPANHVVDVSSAIPGAYDFEYDYPPPGSPPRPSAHALPNDYGNSNGQLPTSPIRASHSKPSFFRRTVGAILPTHYVRVPTDSQTSRAVGGGIENDGVFANVMAKPQKPQVVRNEDGSVYMVPEDSQKEVPPTYADALTDVVPPYWETTVHAPISLEPGADMIIDDLPSGSFWIFGLNLFISFFFQFIGFLLTYLLHTSHAAKFGSRAGLGLTLIQFGFYSRTMNFADSDDTAEVVSTTNTTTDAGTSTANGGDSLLSTVTSRDWLSFLFMTLGWFLLLSSVIGFWRIKRWEKSIRTAPAPVTPEAIERDIAIRRNIEQVFGISFVEEEDAQTARTRELQVQEEARLTRDLRAAGLL